MTKVCLISRDSYIVECIAVVFCTNNYNSLRRDCSEAAAVGFLHSQALILALFYIIYWYPSIARFTVSHQLPCPLSTTLSTTNWREVKQWQWLGVVFREQFARYDVIYKTLVVAIYTCIMRLGSCSKRCDRQPSPWLTNSMSMPFKALFNGWESTQDIH